MANDFTGPHVEIIRFVELDFSSGVLRMHTRIGPIVWNGNTYVGAGRLAHIEYAKEDTALRPAAVTLTLSGVDATLVTTARSEECAGRSAAVYVGALHLTTGQLLSEPELEFKGTMDFMAVDLDKDAGRISISCDNEFARWDQPRSLLYTHETQQLLFPGDNGLDQVAISGTRGLNWMDKHAQWRNDPSRVGRFIWSRIR